jgi:deoxyribodipyrimidine photo-lyase
MAWCAGLTGVPLVDAGMRQLRAEHWMHNRVRLVTASFLTKTLYLDWRLGAQYFFDLLLDGDVVNNCLNWQWVAGTGTDTRPNRVLNPLRQAERYDPDGAYVRRWVPELAEVHRAAIHRPWQDPALLRRTGYPPPIVDLDEARTRFLAARAS